MLSPGGSPEPSCPALFCRAGEPLRAGMHAPWGLGGYAGLLPNRSLRPGMSLLLSGSQFPWGPLAARGVCPSLLVPWPELGGCLGGMAQLGTSSSGNGCLTSPFEGGRAWLGPWGLGGHGSRGG